MDLATGLVWSTGPDLGWVYYTKAEIIEHCSNLDEGGYSDWRAATQGELLTVANHGAKDHVKLACTLSDNLYWATSPFGCGSFPPIASGCIFDHLTIRRLGRGCGMGSGAMPST